LEAARAEGLPLRFVFHWDAKAEFAPGAASRWWGHHALKELEEALGQKGFTLYYIEGSTDSVYDSLAKSSSRIFLNKTYEPDEEAFLAELGAKVSAHDGATLFAPATTKIYKVFTPFYKYLLTLPLPKPVVPNWRKVSPAPAPKGAVTLEALELLPKIPWDAGFYRFWDLGRAKAFARFKKRVEFDRIYKLGRDLVAEDATTRISPLIAWGQLGPRELANLCAPQSTLLRQLIWREFSLHTLYRCPWMARGKPIKEAFAKMPWQKDKKTLDAWKKGKTGYPLVDAAMRQLWQTGWMHNRARMVVGSFLVKRLLIDWREGEKWFWETLVDADLANNSFSWQWVAGCGLDAAPFFRIFNPTTQQEKFDKDFCYINKYLPEFGTPAYPKPIVDHKEARQRALDALKGLKK